jgi:hypothetical protein
LIKKDAVQFIEQLIAYGLPVPAAIQEGWHLIYDMTKQTIDDENPFENLIDATAILNWSIQQINKDLGLNLPTDPERRRKQKE